ncbi:MULTISPECIES: helix-turn-helix transcriptional regulator [Vibrio]|uniref:helix-turn-helix transcriptional regulator n=1 Tax=Vibrio TaxID=662 RepID=UPI00080336C1|nr:MULTISPECIES: AlpA family transcriptional regulator [Vibrio]MDF5003968.1 AlpA family transcriptional regulator [Vibrio parahaemolyticus]ANP63868.1 hypothetical protein BAU10_02235 [Vibrio alginolyticus]MBS9934502.1 AlpA family transcriptional regulator [Vibrio alginolyticus]MDW1926215.1 AlpA family transcriptional regulator [Vibrio sp. 947]MDW1976478.1 AlpA family transcriptional regulator [Vibrio sp. Vb1980]
MSHHHNDHPTKNQVRFIRLSEVLNRTGLSKAHVYRLMNDGEFPQTVSLGLRAVAWLESEVNQWIEQKLTQRNEVVS